MLLIFWLVLGAAFLIVELLTTSFFILFFGLGALTLGILSMFVFIPFTSQVFAFLIFSVLYLFFFKKVLKSRRKQHNYPRSPNGPNAPIGEYGTAFDEIVPNSYGKVIIRDTVWRATSQNYIRKGDAVQVISQNNLTLEVRCL